jgi:hypothetical protein
MWIVSGPRNVRGRWRYSIGDGTVVVKMEMAMMIMEGRRKTIEIEKNVAFEMRYR